MLVKNAAEFIDQQEGGDAAKLEEVPFLPVEISHAMSRVGETDEVQFLGAPIALESPGTVRADGEDDRVTRGKSRQVIPQVGEMGAAVRSHETAQENEDDVPATAKIREADGVTVHTGQLEIGGVLEFGGHAGITSGSFYRIRARLRVVRSRALPVDRGDRWVSRLFFEQLESGRPERVKHGGGQAAGEGVLLAGVVGR